MVSVARGARARTRKELARRCRLPRRCDDRGHRGAALAVRMAVRCTRRCHRRHACAQRYRLRRRADRVRAGCAHGRRAALVRARVPADGGHVCRHPVARDVHHVARRRHQLARYVLPAGSAEVEPGIGEYTMANAVVLLSGGLDSATVLAIAREAKYDCYCLSIDYGQRHRAELAAAARVAQALGAREHRVSTLDLAAFGGSALTDTRIAVPTGG